jgi:putative membrane protein
MKLGVVFVMLLGLAATVLLAVWYGLGSVGDALELAGREGLAAITLYHMIPVAVCGVAWRALFDKPPASIGAFIWFRWLRDAGSDILALLPGGGEMLGIRAMKLSGIDTAEATASTVADVTVEICSQIGFILLGLIILLDRPSNPLVPWALLGLAAMIPVAGALVFAQRLGLIGLLERFADKLATGYGWTALTRVNGLEERVHGFYRNRPAIARAAITHLLAWVVGVGEAAIALAFMGIWPGIDSLIVLESLVFAIRTAAFFVPAAAGVQEGGYILVGGVIGIGPEFALALSLLKRGRELILGSLGLVLWHSVESRRLWLKLRLGRALARPLATATFPDTGSDPSDHPHS